MFFQAVRFFFSGMSTVSLVPGDLNGERERLGDLQALANIGGPNVPIEDWMVGLEICGKECVKLIRTFALKSDSLTDRMAPLMLSRCLAYLFELVNKAQLPPNLHKLPSEALCCSHLFLLTPRAFLETRTH